jgi:hypothetical protein
VAVWSHRCQQSERSKSGIGPNPSDVWKKISRFENLPEYLTNIHAKINIIFKNVFFYPDYATA